MATKSIEQQPRLIGTAQIAGLSGAEHRVTATFSADGRGIAIVQAYVGGVINETILLQAKAVQLDRPEYGAFVIIYTGKVDERAAELAGEYGIRLIKAGKDFSLMDLYVIMIDAGLLPSGPEISRNPQSAV